MIWLRPSSLILLTRVFAVRHLRQHSARQQITQLPGIESIAFAACIHEGVLARIADDDFREYPGFR